MISVSFRGNNYQLPEPADAFTQALTDFLNALSTGAVPYPTTADIDLGASFGIKALDFKTRAANPSASGLVRLSLADLIAWRNNANSADVALGVGGQDQLQWRGSDVTGNPMLGASTAAGQSITNSIVTIVVFGTVERDSDSAYSSGTGRYTIPTGKGGDYQILAEIAYGSALTATDVRCSIYKNAVEVKKALVANPAGSQTIPISAILNLAAGDIIDIRAFQNSAGASTLAASALLNYFALKRIPV